MSEITTDISVPRWSENHRIMKIMFTKFVADNSIKTITNNKLKIQNIQQKIVQKRYELKGEIVDINNKLFSHLRFTFTALGEKTIPRSIFIR